MVIGFLLLPGLLADSRAEEARVALEKAELAAYPECRDARSPEKVWKVHVADAWLRAGDAPEARLEGVLHRGETVTLLKRWRSGNLLVKTGEGRKGYLWSDEVIEVVIPPRDPRPVEDCPQPGFLREPRYPMYRIDPPETGPEPGPADLESLEVDAPPP